MDKEARELIIRVKGKLKETSIKYKDYIKFTSQIEQKPCLDMLAPMYAGKKEI